MSDVMKRVEQIEDNFKEGADMFGYGTDSLSDSSVEYLISTIKQLHAENERYKKTLEFYADFFKYNYGGDADAMKKVSKSVITQDGGETARKALEK